jgi:hypothetical protein
LQVADGDKGRQIYLVILVQNTLPTLCARWTMIRGDGVRTDFPMDRLVDAREQCCGEGLINSEEPAASLESALSDA